MQTPGRNELGFLPEEAFLRRLHLEQRRTERSRRPFVFVLLESALLNDRESNGACDRILSVLAQSLRETDIRGWYEHGSGMGLIFTEVGPTDAIATGASLLNKVRGLVKTKLSPSEYGQIQFSFFVFPDDWDKAEGASRAVLYPESVRERRSAQIVKRAIDIGGSLAALIVGAPLFLVIGAAVKLTSAGPVFFRQKRVGQYGRKFTFLKFRSMYVNNDHGIHREYVQNLIAGMPKSGEKTVYKLTDDPRITPFGKFIRKTSLDEIPQFLNVLVGDMSLVGPRPPVPYEVDAYDIWHRRRLVSVKPGITGLWQVNGRSRTTFDEMVRLDLQYAKSWSIWMDLKILVRTPLAVIGGDGAY